MNMENTPQSPAERVIQRLRISVLESRVAQLGTDWRLDLCSPFWRLYVNDRSGAWIVYKGRKLALHKGEIWIVPAWVRFQTGARCSVQQDYLHFDVRGLPPVFFQRAFDRPVRLAPSVALRAVCREWLSRKEFPQLCWAGALAHAAFAGAVSDFLAGCAVENFPKNDQDAGIRRALDVLEARMAEPPANEELARLCGSSEDHFIRRFRHAMGVTPASYGRARRLAAAAEWLSSSARTIDDIAAGAGFVDRFHFSRAFKVRFGQSPAAYRRMHRREFDSLVDPTAPRPSQTGENIGSVR